MQKTQALLEDLHHCYHVCKDAFGNDFESVVADAAAEIILLQHKLGPDYTVLSACMLLCAPDAECMVSEETIMVIKAATIWMIKNNLD